MKRYIARWSVAALLAASALAASNGLAQVNSTEGNALIFQVNGLEYMRVSGTAGYVGIGTTGPAYPFDVSSSGSGGRFYTSNTTLSYLDVQNTGTATNAGSVLRLISKNVAKSADNTVDFVKYQGGAFYINHNETNAAASMNFGVGGSARMTIDSGGDVGIGATSPLAKLDVNGTISASDAIQVGTSSLTCTAGVPGAIRYNSGNIQFCNGTSWATVGTSTAPGSGGDIVFNNGSGFAADTGQLYWDATNNRLGIGTSSPQATLQVSGSFTVSTSAQTTTPSLYVGSNGNVGIGTASPARKLHIAGSAPIMGFEDTDNGKNWIVGYDSGLTGVNFGEVGVADGRLFLDDGGNVGIGLTAPNSKLEVNGVIATQGSPFSLRQIYGNYGFMHYQDGSNYYMLVTNSGDQYGSYNSLRPFYVNLASGNVTLGAGALYAQHGGNVGIATSSPNARLDVNGAVSATAFQISGVNVVPAGAIIAFDLASCPSGWTEYTAARGRFLRGIDNGAGNDPDGTRAAGSTQADAFASHTHTYFESYNGNAMYASTNSEAGNKAGVTSNSGATGGTETRPKNVAVLFCRKS